MALKYTLSILEVMVILQSYFNNTSIVLHLLKYIRSTLSEVHFKYTAQEKIMLFIVDVGFIGVLSVNFSCTKIPSNSSTFLEIP